MSSELPPVGSGWGTGFFVMDRGNGEMSAYLAGYRKVVRVVRWFLLDDMAGKRDVGVHEMGKECSQLLIWSHGLHSHR